MRRSLKDYIIDLGKWGLLVMGVNIFNAIGAYSAITGSPIIDIPTWVWLSLLIIGLLIAPFFAYHKKRTKLNSILSVNPNLEIDGCPYIDARPIYSRKEIEGQYPLIGKPYFAHVKFCNKPNIPTEQATAKDVIAEISFYNNAGEPIPPDNLLGRWGDKEQPKSYFEPIRELAKVDFEPNGLYHELDVAMKYPEDEDCYAFGNESYFSYGWKKPSFSLKGHSFKVKIRLVGVPMVDKTWWFTLHNEGTGKSMRIELAANTMDTPSNKS
jgi:hypothetical protein